MSVLNVQCHASGEVRCSVVISVVIGICLIELSVPLVQFYFSTLCLDSPSLSRSHFSHMCSLYFHGILGVVFTCLAISLVVYSLFSCSYCLRIH